MERDPEGDQAVVIEDVTWAWEPGAPARGLPAGEPESRPAAGVISGLRAGPVDGPVVLLLHGARFSSATWRENGTLEFLAARGFQVVAIDLPGFGRSQAVSAGPDEFLAQWLPTSGLRRPVVVSPSMSGRFSFPLVIECGELVAGFVPVAPAALDAHAGRLGEISVPTLVFWGAQDHVFPVDGARTLGAGIADSRVRVIEGADHACYLDQPALFHAELVDWLDRFQGD